MITSNGFLPVRMSPARSRRSMTKSVWITTSTTTLIMSTCTTATAKQTRFGFTRSAPRTRRSRRWLILRPQRLSLLPHRSSPPLRRQPRWSPPLLPPLRWSRAWRRRRRRWSLPLRLRRLRRHLRQRSSPQPNRRLHQRYSPRFRRRPSRLQLLHHPPHLHRRLRRWIALWAIGPRSRNATRSVAEGSSFGTARSRLRRTGDWLARRTRRRMRSSATWIRALWTAIWESGRLGENAAQVAGKEEQSEREKWRRKRHMAVRNAEARKRRWRATTSRARRQNRLRLRRSRPLRRRRRSRRHPRRLRLSRPRPPR